MKKSSVAKWRKYCLQICTNHYILNVLLNKATYYSLNLFTACGTWSASPSRAPEFTPGFQCSSCFSIFNFLCNFCRLLFVLLSFFFWPLYCLCFFDLFTATDYPLVYSTFSFSVYAHLYGYGGSPRIQGSIIDIRIDKTSYKYQLQNRP
jgi:hypothetical protein